MERVLRRAPEEQKAQIWTKWMRIYWDDRVNGRPCELLPKEAEEMLEWAFVVGDAFPGAVDLILRGPKITGQFGTVCYILQKHEAPEKHPEVVLRLLDWLLQDRTTQYRISNDIEKVIFRLPKSLFEKELSS
jgi:hypothetical protein